jgi:hypothetical protein
MTAPIQEPLTQRSIAGLQYGTNQLFRRPDVTPAATAGGTTSAYFDDYDWTGTGSQVATNTWVDVITGDGSGANQRFFDEICFDPDGDWAYDFTSGEVWSAPGATYLYSMWGFVEFTGPDGTVIGAGIEIVGGEFQFNTGTKQAGEGRIMVSAERTLASGTRVKLLGLQASGVNRDLIRARLHIRRHELFTPYTCDAP